MADDNSTECLIELFDKLSLEDKKELLEYLNVLGKHHEKANLNLQGMFLCKLIDKNEQLYILRKDQTLTLTIENNIPYLSYESKKSSDVDQFVKSIAPKENIFPYAAIRYLKNGKSLMKVRREFEKRKYSLLKKHMLSIVKSYNGLSPTEKRNSFRMRVYHGSILTEEEKELIHNDEIASCPYIELVHQETPIVQSRINTSIFDALPVQNIAMS